MKTFFITLPSEQDPKQTVLLFISKELCLLLRGGGGHKNSYGAAQDEATLFFPSHVYIHPVDLGTK